jgi:cytochrome c oxidase assembly factor CtaG
MTYLTDHWSAGLFVIVAFVLAAWYEVGIARLPAAERAGYRGLRSVSYYAGLLVLILTVGSPIGYWSYDYFFIHMVQHLLLMFAVPTLIVAAAPWRPLAAAVRGASQRPGPDPDQAADSDPLDSKKGPVAALGRAVLRPWVSVAIFNVVMIAWHMPGPLDVAERNGVVHNLMYGTFLIAGVLFWLQYIGSPPFRIRWHPASQAGALLLTNVMMWILAMAMGILTSSSWYSVYDHVHGVTLPPFADQQIGAGILWVCGDFWAIPAMVLVIRRLISEDGSVASAVDRILGRGSDRYQWLNRS